MKHKYAKVKDAQGYTAYIKNTDFEEYTMSFEKAAELNRNAILVINYYYNDRHYLSSRQPFANSGSVI